MIRRGKMPGGVREMAWHGTLRRLGSTPQEVAGFGNSRLTELHATGIASGNLFGNR